RYRKDPIDARAYARVHVAGYDAREGYRVFVVVDELGEGCGLAGADIMIFGPLRPARKHDGDSVFQIIFDLYRPGCGSRTASRGRGRCRRCAGGDRITVDLVLEAALFSGTLRVHSQWERLDGRRYFRE